ncbi:MAG: ABC transporter ATP-binding protein [Bacteroidetes bacterium MedPE-SWsnd-G1]|nr:MAG: ABC transporter ATP-binding protein [Bacteroidetes bacterium MedPE-SWsnd-G1]
MFDLDRWREIFQSMGKNKLRTILSGFTITFAIMLFTILLGMGNGLKNTFSSFFERDAENAIFIWPNRTTKAYKGFQSGRRIEFKNEDVDFIKENYPGQFTGLIRRNQRSMEVSYKNEKSNYQVIAVDPDIQFIEKASPVAGRFINQLDLNKKSKTIAIGRMVEKDLFPKGISAVGKYVNVGGLAFKVIGVFSDPGGDNEERFAYIPITTSQMIYGNNDKVDQINLLYNPDMSIEEAVAFGNKMRRDFKKRHNVAPTDQRGIRVLNRAEMAQGTGQVSGALDMIVIIISIGTLIAGIVGISNIMVYIVKERTKELGIRKALGAKPSSIITMILFEALFITSFAGYFGLLIGTGVLEFAAPRLEKYFIKDPSVDSGIIIFATILLMISGIIAGYLPARRAAKIKPIVALRDD